MEDHFPEDIPREDTAGSRGRTKGIPDWTGKQNPSLSPTQSLHKHTQEALGLRGIGQCYSKPAKITSKSVVRMQKLIPCCPGSLQPLPQHEIRVKKNGIQQIQDTKQCWDLLDGYFGISKSHFRFF